MPKRNRIKKSLTPAAITRDQAETALARIRDCEINRQSALAALNRAKAHIDAQYADTLSTYDIAIKQNTETLQHWAEQNPDAFGKLKSITWPDGKFGFRTGTPKLALASRRLNWKAVLEYLTLAGRWIRNQPEIDKEAILADYAGGNVTETQLSGVGLKVIQDETFFIEPTLETADPRQVNSSPSVKSVASVVLLLAFLLFSPLTSPLSLRAAPTLQIRRANDATVLVTLTTDPWFPSVLAPFTILETAPTCAGPWTMIPHNYREESPGTGQMFRYYEIPTTNPAAYFRINTR
jgi:phage host-nuclease inhibitor protein Gam